MKSPVSVRMIPPSGTASEKTDWIFVLAKLQDACYPLIHAETGWFPRETRLDSIPFTPLDSEEYQLC